MRLSPCATAKLNSTRHTVGSSSDAFTLTSPKLSMISCARLFSSSTITCERIAARTCAVFLLRTKRARSDARSAGITSSTIRTVVSSRQVLSAAPPVVVRVVMPRTMLTSPLTHSSGVTPPVTRVSTCVSS